MIKKMLSNEFNRNVFTLLTGTVIAQVIPIVISPILTRLYSPDDFGIFALYMSVTTILSVMATGRYELAIILPEKDEEAFNIAILAVIISIIFSFVLLLIVILFNQPIAMLLGSEQFSSWLYFVPLTILLTALFQSLNYWSNRKKKYKSIAKSKMSQAFGAGAINLSMGIPKIGVIGLIFGNIISQIIGSSILLKTNISDIRKYKSKILYEDIKATAYNYRDFPKFLVFSHTLNTASLQLSNVLLSVFYSATSVGYFSLALRTLRLPITIIASSIGDVFRQQAAEEFVKKGNCKRLYINTLIKLVSISIIPFLILYFSTPWLFSFVFGDNWRVAGIYARVMLIMVFLQFITSPLSSMFLVAEKQRLDLIWQIALFVSTSGSIVIGYFVYNDILKSIQLFTLSYSLMYIINLILTYSFAKGK